jgi:hypothetical protein
MLNNGNGMISPVAAGGLPAKTTIAADFDGDGNVDVAGAPANAGLEVFPGNGDGTFQQPVAVQGPAAVGAVALSADLNGDGATDLITINTDNTISVLLNVGTDFSLLGSPLSPGSISPGQSATSTIRLKLLTLFNNPVALSCSVQPSQAGASCSLNANSVTFDSSGNATATLTVVTSPSLAWSGASPRSPFRILWWPLAGFAFIGTHWRGRLKNTKLIFFLAVVVSLISISQTGCGGGRGARGAQSYTINVTGTSGTTQHSTSLTLKVQ